MADKDIKPISINPELFKVSSAQFSSKAKTLKKKNPKINPTQIRKDLLEKIKRKSRKPKTLVDEYENSNNDSNNIKKSNHFESNTNNLSDESNNSQNKSLKNNLNKTPEISVIVGEQRNTNSTEDKDDDFNQSIEYLKNLSLKKSKRKLDKQSEINKDFPINLTENYKDAPRYGCLKNGILPTFRQFHNKTIKNNKTLFNYKNPNLTNKTVKYYLGKKGKIVSILVKNKESRKKILNECNKIKEVSLVDMKNYLKRHNFLKSGTLAPPEIIKKMYEQCLLAGDIRNLNKKSIVHNYLVN